MEKESGGGCVVGFNGVRRRGKVCVARGLLDLWTLGGKRVELLFWANEDSLVRTTTSDSNAFCNPKDFKA